MTQIILCKRTLARAYKNIARKNSFGNSSKNKGPAIYFRSSYGILNFGFCDCFPVNWVHKMPEIIGKLMKPDGSVATELEKQVSQALVDLESSTDIKAQLRELYIVGVREIEIGNKSVIVVYVPVPQLKQFHKVQVRLVRELEKKFGGKHVLFLAKRRILPKPLRGSKKVPMKQKRPRSRTLTAVHEAWLDEMVFPAEVVGKRTRVKLDGKKLLKVHLDKAQQTNVEHKVDTFVAVYRKLTGKEVVFEFPDPIF
ncbi:unnamed protein product [Cylicocyclus nassatus]|uniref:40S ribosomal protein S7 n=1 Tax=Cylicocyclus nassatus TaxID=53992 RepID=A0AA36M3S1_CYLNA|nr:unnamed protein product [Cylicocyclus nassatus]